MHTSIRRSALLAVAALALASQTAGAQASIGDKLSIHGYLTQGYAVSDSAVVEGIPKEGTSDYRRAALLLRYATTDNDNFIVQFAHRRLGTSPSMQFESDVKVDWAFLEHTFGAANTRLRVGKAPIPFGIYNETRYVGTQLPFYRAPYAMYHEGVYTSETVDGLTLTQPLFSGSAWAMEASGYAGSYSYLDFMTVRVTPTTYSYVGQRVRASNAVGGQLWISTPIDGLRIGGGGSRYTVANAFFQPGKYSFDGYFASVDGKFDRFLARSEFRRVNAHKIMGYNAWYNQAAFSITQKLSVNGQAERANYAVMIGAPYKVELIKDDAVGVNYAFPPMLLFKVEGHNTRGHNIDGVLDARAASVKGRYAITSLSVAF